MTVQPQMKKEAKCKVRPARSRAAGKSINRCVAPTGHGDTNGADPVVRRHHHRSEASETARLEQIPVAVALRALFPKGSC